MAQKRKVQSAEAHRQKGKGKGFRVEESTNLLPICGFDGCSAVPPVSLFFLEPVCNLLLLIRFRWISSDPAVAPVSHCPWCYSRSVQVWATKARSIVTSGIVDFLLPICKLEIQPKQATSQML